MTCPSPDQLLAFAAGQLDATGLGAIEAHIDTCTDCRGALSNFARGDVPPSFGRYRIDTVLGSGGMGIVYRAWDPQLARAVAIKVVRRASDDEKGRARLIREAQALARLSHPNVCHVYDVGTEDEEVWVAMELIDGVSLREWVNREALLEVLLGAARGIAAAHDSGLVHRDIKPENVLVTRDARAIVTDFGLARGEDIIDPNASTLSTDPHLTATGAIAGTPAYIAPEQLTGDPIDARVDQFAFAVMAWELLTGTKPFPIIIALRVDAVRAGVTPPPTLPKHLAVALAKAMAAAPRDRFPTMRELIEAMEQPVRARARTKTGPHGSAARSRGPVYASLGLLAMTGAAITAWQWPRHAHEQVPPPIIVQKTITPPPPPVPPGDAASVAVTLAPDAAVAIATHTRPHEKVAAAVAPIQHQQTQPKTTIPPTTNPPPVVGEGSGSDTTQKITMTSEQGSQALAVQKRHSHSGTERRDAAIATMDAFCYLPYDVAHPDKDLPRPVVDWGKVSSITPETGHLMGDDIDSNILTIKGARGTYRVMQEVGTLNYVVPAQVGDWMALCADREESDIYRFPGGPTLPVESIVPLRAPPRITELAKYKPLHIRELAMIAAGANQHHNLHEDRAYVIRAKVVDLGNGKRLKMDRYYMDVPPSIKLEVGKLTWVVVDHLHYEDADDTGKKPFVVRAIAVLDGDMFPG
jgi:serine/threonine protein kinase